MRNYDLAGDYGMRFQKPIPQLYMRHLSDEAFNALIEKALADGKEIDPESFYKVPEGALI